ncbi:asparagine synthase-domain-containing protein [Leucosporidium creatinivorum]|uniref:Asparagine synthase-domain-containing protein n=1 Tax=Leucosporidium creatinivorum TaxID=106004 RepID=A0A1Y2FY92_9BASI|nr:asparagine synthase-domain-containing protein [Leucosporidium creatinivorum]
MCGICFGIRTSASYASSGASPTDEGLATSPASAASPSSSSTHEHDPDFGLTFPDGSKPDLGSYLDANECWRTLIDAVRPRGPDASNSLIRHVQVRPKQPHWEMRFHASILHMRGKQVTVQPFTAPNGDVFLWNGEIFDGVEVAPTENDGAALFALLLREGPSNFFAAIRNVEGPYAFIYYQALNHRVYFARDPLGRRSLLMHRPTPVSPSLFLTSNAPSVNHPLNDWEEVPCDSIFAYHLLDLKGKNWGVDGRRGLSAYPRYPKSMGLSQDILIYPFDRLLSTLPLPANLLPLDRSATPPAPIITAQLHLTIQALHRELESSLRKRILTVPAVPPPPQARIAILFSGGLDCTTLALMVDRILPGAERIDLINVAFENPRVVEGKARDAAAKAKGGKKKAPKAKKGKGKQREENGMEVDGVEAAAEGDDVAMEDGEGEGEGAGDEAATADNTDAEPETEFEGFSKEASPVAEAPPLLPAEPAWPDAATQPSSPTGLSATPSVDPSVYEVPDRLTGKKSWQELRSLRPARTWNFVEVNVPYQEMLEHRPKVIDLMRPQRTVMDLSIAIAFYFAARGQGQLAPVPPPSAPSTASPSAPTAPAPYHSQARVLLSGLGADELLGGYARHRRAFFAPPTPAPAPVKAPPTASYSFVHGTTPVAPPLPVEGNSNPRAPNGKDALPPTGGNWSALLAELQMDLDRLPVRNLGRDDRIISYWGKEVRYPFLAGHVIDFIARTPVWMKMDFRFEEGVGDKMLLRLLAKRLGLEVASAEKKRAIHFGARTAKMELGSGRDKGEMMLE